LVKKKCLKKTWTKIHSWGLNALYMQKYFWFVSSFEHVKFTISEKHSQNIMTIQTIMLPFVIFQTYKNAI
jgi:hypothetical protein